MFTSNFSCFSSSCNRRGYWRPRQQGTHCWNFWLG